MKKSLRFLIMPFLLLFVTSNFLMALDLIGRQSVALAERRESTPSSSSAAAAPDDEQIRSRFAGAVVSSSRASISSLSIRSLEGADLIQGPFSGAYEDLSLEAKEIAWQMAFFVMEYALKKSSVRAWAEDVAVVFKDNFVQGIDDAGAFYKSYVFGVFDKLKIEIGARIRQITSLARAAFAPMRTDLFVGFHSEAELLARLNALVEWIIFKDIDIWQTLFPLEEAVACEVALVMLKGAVFAEGESIRDRTRAIIALFADTHSLSQEQAENFCKIYVMPRINFFHRLILPEMITAIIQKGHGEVSSFSIGVPERIAKDLRLLPEAEMLIDFCETLAYELVGERGLATGHWDKYLKPAEKLNRILRHLAALRIEW